MSDHFHWLPIGLWSAAIGFQIGTAIRDYWTDRNERTTPTGYDKVLSGESVNGWRVAVFNDRFRELCKQSHEAYYVYPKEPESEAEMIRQALDDNLTMLMNHAYFMPDGRQVVTLSRVSLIAPNVSTTICRIICSERWSFCGCGYFSKRTLISIHREEAESSWTYHLVFFDLIDKSHRIIPIESPTLVNGFHIRLFLIYPGPTTRRYLHVVYALSSMLEAEADEGKFVQSFTEMRYEIPQSTEPIRSPIKATSWHSVSIPALEYMCWAGWSDYCLYPQQAILFEGADRNIERHRCFLCDRNGNWQIKRLSDWVALFRATTHGAKVIKAAEDLDSLSPPEECKLCDLRPLRYGSGLIIGGVLYWMGKGNVIQRLVYPPSLQRLAADAFMRANHGFDKTNLHRVIGFDIFEGAGEEDNPRVIYV